MRNKLFFLLAAVLLYLWAAWPAGRYQVVKFGETPSGSLDYQIMKIDTVTGKTWLWVYHDFEYYGWRPVKKGNPTKRKVADLTDTSKWSVSDWLAHTFVDWLQGDE